MGHVAVPIPKKPCSFPLPAQAEANFSGDHGEKVTPVPIPNTAVKGLIGEGTAGVARGRVARCRDLFRGAAGRSTCGPPFRLTVKPLNRFGGTGDR